MIQLRTRSWLGSILAVVLLTPCADNLFADDWPQWLGPQRDGVWRETGILQEFPADGPPVLWRTPIAGGYAGPAVADSRVYVTDRVIAEGDDQVDTERVICLDEKNGQVIWIHEYECPYSVSYPAGPRCTPIIADGKVYTLGSEGNLLCLSVDDGSVVWSRAFKPEFNLPEAPVWGFSANPLLDGNRLICLVGGPGSVAVAFDKDTGKEIWRSLSASEPGYCPPVIFEAGGTRQLIIWHADAVNGLNPLTGEAYWTEPFESRFGMSIATPRKLGNQLLVTTFFNGPLMLQLAANEPLATLQWKGDSFSERNTDKLHAVMCTPFLEDGHIYGVCSYGQLRCLDAATGERIWEDLSATGSTGDVRNQVNRWANAFLVKHEDRYFIANEHGDLIIAKMSPQGYEEISRAHVIEPTNPRPGRKVVWAHPAFANRCVYLRNDEEIVCLDLREN